MLRLRLDPTAPCVPEISANKYVLNIRFLQQNGADPRPRTADWDVAFELTFCNL
jgi:cell division protein ZapD